MFLAYAFDLSEHKRYGRGRNSPLQTLAWPIRCWLRGVMYSVAKHAFDTGGYGILLSRCDIA